MSDNYRSPVSVVIFDRTKLYGSDVPVFSAALKQKVNTPVPRSLDEGLSSQTQAIFQALSTSCADSFGGQTNESVQGAEPQPVAGNSQFLISNFQPNSPVNNHDKENGFVQPERSSFFEDPTVIRPHGVTYLRALLLSSTHTGGIVERVILPSHSMSLTERLEPTYFASKRLLRKVVAIRYQVSGLRSQIAGIRREVSGVRDQILDIRYLVPGARDRIQKIQHRVVRTLTGATDELSAVIRLHRFQFNLVSVASKTLIAGSMVLMLLTVGPMVALQAESWRVQIAYSIKNMASQAVESSYPSPTLAPQATPVPTPTPDPSPDKQFQVVIPKIGVDSKVIANVDASDEKAYDAALKLGVAHAQGTGLPGQENAQNKTIFIFGHSTNATWNIARYNALFYSLKDLSVGDDLSVWYEGRQYSYTVTGRKIIAPDDISFLIPQTQKEQLILQTCWPPGTSAQRLLVIAEPKS